MAGPCLRRMLVAGVLAAAAWGFAPGAGPASAGEAPDAEKAAQAQRLADLLERMKSSDVEVRRQAFAEAVRDPAPEVGAAMGKALADADEKVRRSAIQGLAARTDAAAKKKAAEALAGRLPRLTKTEQWTERLAVLQALHDLAQPSSLKALTEGLDFDMAPEELALRLKAVANLPCDEALDFLVKFRASFGRGNRGGAAYWNRMVRDAWVYATGQRDLGNDPDAWRAWWNERRATWDHAEALARRREQGGGPAAREGDDADTAKDGRRPR